MQTSNSLAPPSFVEDRCVHARIEAASCTACIDVCPSRALVLQDRQLGIDEVSCDGCGVCAAVCPQEAIDVPHARLILAADGVTALAACGVSGVDPELSVSCLHAFGLPALTRAYAAGIRTILIASGDCARCPHNPAEGFEDYLGQLRRLTESRSLPSMRVVEHSAADWQRAANRIVDEGRRPSRRALLGLRGSKSDASPRSAEPGQEPWRPAVAALGGAEAAALAKIRPVLDPSACTGCDACVRICPTEALRLELSERGSMYHLRGWDCSGCGLCVDICAEEEAIELVEWCPGPPVAIPLTEGRCSGCGVPFHQPFEIEESLCRICRVAPHFRYLHQRL